MQIVVELLHEVGHELAYAHLTSRRHVLRAELGLGLRLEERFLHLYAYGAYYRHANVVGIEIFPVKLAYHLHHRFAKGRLMGTPLRGVLAVDERVICLAVAAAVGHGYLYVFAFEVYGFVDRLLGERVVEQVQKPLFGEIGGAVEAYGEAGVEIGVVLDHRLDIFEIVGVGAEDALVGRERYLCAVLLRGVALVVARKIPGRKLYGAAPSVAHAGDGKTRRQGIDRLDADAVETYRLLERLGVVFASRVHLGCRCLEAAEGYAASVVAYGDGVSLHGYVYAFAVAHGILVDGVVDHLLYEYVYAVVG